MQKEAPVGGIWVGAEFDAGPDARGGGGQIKGQVHMFHDEAEGRVIFKVDGLGGGVAHGASDQTKNFPATYARRKGPASNLARAALGNTALCNTSRLMTAILWFKRDLRIHDHPALLAAARQGACVPLYIYEPEYWALPDVSGRQLDFVTEAVDDLRRQLASIGAQLAVRVGSAVQVLEDVRRAVGATHLFSHEETGCGWSYARDRAVAVWARDQGVVWEEHVTSGIVRRLPTRDRWAADRNRFLRQDVAAVPGVLPGPRLDSDPVPRLVEVDHCPARQVGGRAAGVALLDSFLTRRGVTYRKAMSSPLEGAFACSRLSPHLAFGTVSGREAAQATAARQRAIKGTREGWGGALKSYQARLAWRDHFMQKLEDEPRLQHHALHSAYEDLRARVPDAARLSAWCKGETGLPFVDACMRSLIATGWLNFRMRAMLVAVASYHLWLDWRASGQHLARMFTDFEPGIHWPQVQMQSGTTGMNTIRIYNPVKQGKDQDPTGAFTRRWVPELAAVPDALLQTPWAWDGAGRLHYPPPIVDVAAAAREAKDRIFALRKQVYGQAETARVIDKHASRKDPQKHFVNDRAPRRRAVTPLSDPRQKGFDF